MSLIIPVNAWEQVTPEIFSTEANRSAELYKTLVMQFNVETSIRYTKKLDSTFCNIFCSDVSLAMQCPIPHWADPITGAKVPMGKGKELSANGTYDWFVIHGMKFGWMQCGEEQARKRASDGYMTIGTWKNSNGPGHIVVILPGTDFTHIAQAGGTNFFDQNIVKGFGNLLSQVLYYTHD